MIRLYQQQKQLMETVELLLEVGGAGLSVVVVNVGETRPQGVSRKLCGGVDDHGEKLGCDGAVEPRSDDGIVPTPLWCGIGGVLFLF